MPNPTTRSFCSMKAKAFILCALIALNAVAVAADKIKMELRRVDGCSFNCGEERQTTVMVLTPRRHSDGHREGAIPSRKYPRDVYDKPVALLVVENLENHPIDLVDLNVTGWFVEIVVDKRSHKSGLMLPASSCPIGYVRRIPPCGKIALLVGRPCTQSKYEFRVGCHPDVLKRQNDSTDENRPFQYTNWLTVDAASKNEIAPMARDKPPKMSLLRLDNNLRNKNLDNVIRLDGRGMRNFVDCVVLLENENDFPIRVGGLNRDNWKIVTTARDGTKSICHPFPMSRDEDARTLLLGARETVVVPLTIEMDLADYKNLESLQMEYSANGEQAETIIYFLRSEALGDTEGGLSGS